jgi:hypothetical protein
MHRMRTTPTNSRYMTLCASLIFFSVLLFRMDYLAIRKTSFDFKVLDKAADVQVTEDTNGDEIQKLVPPPKDKTPTPALPVPIPPPRRDYPRATNLTKTATIVIQLSGELANHLQHMAHGIAAMGA